MSKLNEVVVVDIIRSAIGRSSSKGMDKNGQLCHASAQDLLAAMMRGVLDRVKEKAPKFDERDIEDVLVGCGHPFGEQGANLARWSMMLAGIPETVCAFTLNQYCNSGLKAVNLATQGLQVGDGEIMLCGGIEVISHCGMGWDIYAAEKAGYPFFFSSHVEKTGMLTPQGMCAEIIAENEGYTREDLDRYSMTSMQKAVKAQANGWFDDHILPFKYTWDGQEIVVDKDETLRPKSVEDPEGYMADLGKLRPSFKENGIVTPGNSSQIVDGAAAALLMTADKAEELGLDPLCRIIECASVGSAPMPMLLGPTPACKKALARAGKTMDDMDVIVANEAFASPCLVWAKDLGYDVYEDRYNPFGGAIGLGHPIGASGLIYFGEMLHHLKRMKGKYGIKTLCGGGGLGIATVVEAL